MAMDINLALNTLIQKYAPNSPNLNITDILTQTDVVLKNNYALAGEILKKQGALQSTLPDEINKLHEKLNLFTQDIRDLIPKLTNMLPQEKFNRYLGDLE